MADLNKNGVDDAVEGSGSVLLQQGGSSGSSSSAGLVGWYSEQTGKLAVATVAQVKGALVSWYKNEPARFAAQARVLKAAGYANDGTFNTVYSAWGKAIEDASNFRDTMDINDFLLTEAGVRKGAGGPGAYMGPTSQTNISTAADADAIVDDFYGKYFGSTPDEVQRKEFRKLLNSMERKNPTVSTPNGKHSTTVSGGFGAQAAAGLAEDFVKGQEGFAETQAATTGLSWLADAIKQGDQERLI